MTSTDNKKMTENIPNKAFDSEYMTEWVREVKFLADKGIKYVFVKKTPEYNIKQYKYTKTPELFVALAEFYYNVANERAYNSLNKAIEASASLPKELAEVFAKATVEHNAWKMSDKTTADRIAQSQTHLDGDVATVKNMNGVRIIA